MGGLPFWKFKDQREQWTLGLAAVLASLAALASVVFTGFQWSAANRSAAAADRSANFAKQTLDSARPWVGMTSQIQIERAAFKVSPESSNLLMSGTYRLKNFGLSPAFGVNSIFNVVIQKDTVHRPAKGVMYMRCPDRDAKQDLGEVIFPGAEVINGFGQDTSFDKSFTEVGRVWILGCVSYQDGTGALRHTRFWFRSVHPDNAQWIKEKIGRPFKYMPITGFESWGQETD
jgi:hypothetical protein